MSPSTRIASTRRTRDRPQRRSCDDAIRAGRSPTDNRLGALSTLARTLIDKPRRIDDQDRERFLATGFGKDHLLEVITVIAASTITDYTGNVTNPSLEAPF